MAKPDTTQNFFDSDLAVQDAQRDPKACVMWPAMVLENPQVIIDLASCAKTRGHERTIVYVAHGGQHFRVTVEEL